MSHIKHFFIILAVFCLAALAVSSVAAQEDALADRPRAGNLEIHLIPENAPVEIWRTDGDRLVEGWLSSSAWRRLDTTTIVPVYRAAIAVHPVLFTEQVNIWRMDGSQIVEGWVSAPSR